MNPKKPSYFIKLTAEQLGISEELVKDIVDMYWGDVRKNMSELNHHSVHIIGLGTFKLRFWKLDEARERCEKLLAKNTGKSFRQMTIKNELEDKVSKINKVQKMVQEELERKRKIKASRYDKTKSDLEEPITNIGGSNELNPEEGPGGTSVSQANEDMQPVPTPRQDRE